MSDEPTQEEIDELNKVLQKQVKKNVELETSLIDQGFQPNPYVIAMMRLNLLLDAIFDVSTRMQYEIESAKRVESILMQIQQQAHEKLEEARKPQIILPQPQVKNF